MVEPSVIFWTAIGTIAGALPSVVIALWREIRERRIQRDELEAQQRKISRDIVDKAIDRDYAVLLTDDTQSLQPPKQQPPFDASRNQR